MIKAYIFVTIIYKHNNYVFLFLSHYNIYFLSANRFHPLIMPIRRECTFMQAYPQRDGKVVYRLRTSHYFVKDPITVETIQKILDDFASGKPKAFICDRHGISYPKLQKILLGQARAADNQS